MHLDLQSYMLAVPPEGLFKATPFGAPVKINFQEKQKSVNCQKLVSQLCLDALPHGLLKFWSALLHDI